MRRDQLEHAIRASSEVLAVDRVIIIGSQAVLGTWTEDELPVESTRSIEVDVLPLGDDELETLATQLDGAVGEFSAFHGTHGFYVQGVGANTAILPNGWTARLVPVENANTSGRMGLCLDPVDLCVAKLMALREKDRMFVAALLGAGRVDEDDLMRRIEMVDGHDRNKVSATRWVHNR